MGRIPSIILVSLTLFFFQNCESHHSGDSALNSNSSNGLPPGMTLQVDQNLQAQSLSILSNYCGICHNAASNGGVTQILDVYHLIGVGLVVPGDPSKGRLIGSIQDGTMPKGGAVVTTNELITLKNWITSMKLVGTGTLPGGGVVTPPALPAGKVVRADDVLHAEAMGVLNVNCAGCHQGVVNGGIGSILDINKLVATGLVVAGDASKGRLLGAIADGTMPKGNGARVTASDVQILKNWINSMTIQDETLYPTPMPTRPALTATFTGVFANIIQPKCVACHGPVLTKKFSLDSYSLLFSHRGDVRDKCSTGEMPETPYPAVTGQEMSALQSWINSGAPNN